MTITPPPPPSDDFSSPQWQKWFISIFDYLNGNSMAQLPILQQDLIGNANKYYPNKKFDLVVGQRSGVNNTKVDLWGGPTDRYVFPTTAQQMSLVSTSANDTAAGTGTRTIHVHYLDNNYNEQTEIVTLNGVTPVNTVATNILRINAMHVTTTGSGNTSAGNISLTNTAGTVTYAFIAATYNTARQAIYTVPAGKNGYISHWQASSGAASGTHFTIIDLMTTSHYGNLWNVFLVSDSMGTLNNGAVMTFPIPIQVPPKTDVKISAVSDASNAGAIVNGTIMGWYE